MARDCRRIMIVDLEATCWEKEANASKGEQKNEGEVQEIIEIGITEVDPINRLILRNEGILVRPQKSSISEFCTKLTTITPEMVKDAMTYQEAVAYIKKTYQPQDLMWASYGDYDRNQFRKNDELYGVKNPFSQTHQNVKNLFAIKYGLKWEIGMEKALAHLGWPLEGVHHRGKDDSLNIAKIFLEIIK